MDALFEDFGGVFGENNPQEMPVHLFFGAHQIHYDSAIRADILKQNYSVCPRHWYIDAVFGCRDCKKDFIFTANEQKFWYEERQFWIDSQPKRCPSCRKSERRRRALRKQYDTMIKNVLGRCSLDKKKEVVEIIDELELMGEIFSERMKLNRNTLLAQLKKNEKST